MNAPSSSGHERLLIVDFGSQVTQLIARRVRESGVYCEIHPYDKVDAASLKAFAPKAVILSGGPASVTEDESPRVDQGVFRAGRSGAGHLLRRAGYVRPDRRARGGGPSPRVRPR